MEQIKPIGGSAAYSQPTKPPKPVTTDIPPKPAKDVSPQYVSPRVIVDPKSGVFVTEVRDTGTGKVSFQYPSKKAAAAYANNVPSKADVEEQQQPDANGGKTEDSQETKSSTVADDVTGDKEEQV